jgi:carbon monoxide dehydrogenase subunit G
MKIKNEVRIDIPVEDTWAALNDIPRVARCAPGAELLESRPDDSHVGTISVKLGPIALKFKGTVSFIERDASAHRVVAKAQGNEEKARGTARADVIFVLTPMEAGTRISVESDIQLAGSIAQYGRGTALIQGTAQVLMDQFARNLEANLTAQRSGTDAPAPEEGKDIGLTKVLAKGLWNAGAGLMRKDETDKT